MSIQKTAEELRQNALEVYQSNLSDMQKHKGEIVFIGTSKKYAFGDSVFKALVEFDAIKMDGEKSYGFKVGEDGSPRGVKI